MFNSIFRRSKAPGEYSGIALRDRTIQLIVGLGNPGEAYRGTYHNVGFLFIDALREAEPGGESGKAPPWRNIQSFRYTVAGGLVLIKPSTYMNASGVAVKQALAYFGMAPENLLLVHDDSDVTLGQYKFSEGRGAAGHNGVTSVIERLETNNFLRLRIGVRAEKGKAEEFVLEKMAREHREQLDRLFAEVQTRYFKREGK